MKPPTSRSLGEPRVQGPKKFALCTAKNRSSVKDDPSDPPMVEIKSQLRITSVGLKTCCIYFPVCYGSDY